MTTARVGTVLCAGVLAAVLGSCSFGVDPDGTAKFSCATNEDCGKGYECRPQSGKERGLCYPVGACADNETKCDGADDDCNGLVDDVAWSGEACTSPEKGVCAPGHRVCGTQAGAAVESCVPNLSPSAELCNGLDDDCDGAIDEDFDFTTDAQNCGMCGHACGAGNVCSFGLCVEHDCADGLDNDGDGQADCADSDCLGLTCSASEPQFVCGLLPPDAGMSGDAGVSDAGELDAGAIDAGDLDAGMVDAGDMDAGAFDAGDVDAGVVDGGELDAGGMDAGSVDAGAPVPQCVPPETSCANGADDDGDGKIDCADLDCDGQACGDGGVCTAGSCL